jgi:hypothetical protein
MRGVLPVYIVLLRGVNVGQKTVRVDRLRATFEKLGFSAVMSQPGMWCLKPSEHLQPDCPRRLESESCAISVLQSLYSCLDRGKICQKMCGKLPPRCALKGALQSQPFQPMNEQLIKLSEAQAFPPGDIIFSPAISTPTWFKRFGGLL